MCFYEDELRVVVVLNQNVKGKFRVCTPYLVTHSFPRELKEANQGVGGGLLLVPANKVWDNAGAACSSSGQYRNYGPMDQEEDFTVFNYFSSKAQI